MKRFSLVILSIILLGLQSGLLAHAQCPVGLCQVEHCATDSHCEGGCCAEDCFFEFKQVDKAAPVPKRGFSSMGLFVALRFGRDNTLLCEELFQEKASPPGHREPLWLLYSKHIFYG